MNDPTSTNWYRLWLSRLQSWRLSYGELWDTATTHRCIYTRLAAVELLLDEVYVMDFDEAADLLRLVNRYMSDNAHMMVAVDQLTKHLNLHIDELEREAEEWRREREYRNYAYQYASYPF
jgi:hypothetical protein